MRKTLSMAVLCLLIAVGGQAGETIRVLLGQNIWHEEVRKMIPEFEKETGIRVNMESFHEDQLSQKLAVELTAGTDIDVFIMRPLNEAKLFGRNGWCTDLTPYVKNDPGFDFEDITPGARACVSYEGQLLGIPTSNESHVLYYRKDVFEKHGLQPPATFDELVAAAEKLTDRDNNFFAVLLRGQRSALITQFSSFLYSMGGNWFDPKTNTATFDTPEALQAIDLYGTLLRKYGPDGAPNMSWPQMMAIYQQGNGAMYIDASAHYPMLTDPTKSALADKTGIVPFPAGPAGAKPYDATAWALCIYSQSRHKDASWQFIRYFSDKKRAAYFQGEFGYQGARKSAFEDPAGIKNFPTDLAKILAKQGEYAVGTDRPSVVAVQEARDILGEAVVTSILGGDYQAAAKIANERFQGILDREK
ncbi:MAG: sugar ABC transporter substrate-binding protein [Planctomycetes bacterium]|nr:sugar ABC transporter substrate-binding protein [Planctomycetota bacterium]